MEAPSSNLSASPRATSAPRRWLWLALPLVAGAALRLLPAGEVFTAHGVELSGDDDPAYHVLRAERMLAGAPGAPWRDPGLDYPHGADVPWPPLFDAILAASGKVAALGGVITRERLASGAAVVPVLLALLTLPLVAGLAQVALRGRGLAAALVLALLPAHAVFSMIGRADQHVLELLLSTAALLAVAAGLRDPASRPWPARAALAAALLLGAWNWLGASLHPLLLVAFSALWFVARPAGDPGVRRLAGDLGAGAGLAALALAGMLAALRGLSALAEMSVGGLTGFHVLTLALAAAYGGLLALAAGAPDRLRAWPARALAAAAAGLLPLLAALAVPGFAGAIGHALAGVVRANAWYANIQEFDPLVLAGFEPLEAELRSVLALYGLLLLVVPAGALALVRRIRRGEAPLGAGALILFHAAAFTTLGVARQRFALYLGVPAALLAEAAWLAWGGLLSRRVGPWAAGALALGLVLGPAAPFAGEVLAGRDARYLALRDLLAWSRTLPLDAARPALFSEWSMGHAIQYVAGRPVVSSPFGIEGGARAMEDSARFFQASDAREAEAVLTERRCGLLLLLNPITEVFFSRPFAPEGTPARVVAARSWRGVRTETRAGYEALVPVRLWQADGSGGEAEGLGAYRLLGEALDPDGAVAAKLYGVVPGARLQVRAGAGEEVAAFTTVKTPARSFRWSSTARARPDGLAELRLPYATGPNGRCEADAYTVRAGAAFARLTVGEAAVTGGEAVTLRTAP
ncbi:MAG TPA: STT3 domain-containing protein [Anaeromyxobacteraceae bacterium]|nr:STT3 domain-containing protein [Anaeromyxobacteraceae bacterium]